MGLWYSVSAILLLTFLVVIGIEGMGLVSFFTIFIPYAALFLFVVGFLYRVLKWATSPVPFHIPTVSGQQRSLSWIKADNIDSPYTTGGVVKRLALDILLFRPLLKNEKVEMQAPQRLLFKPSVLLWFGAMAFHWSFLVILLRHLRFFLEPVPSTIVILQRVDSIFQGLIPVIYITDIIILVALGYLFVRRIIYPQVRYISLSSDYFVLLLILGIVLSGVLMRLIYKVDLVQVKEWAMAMLRLRPVAPKEVNLLFYIHLFFISLLVAYFPLSKLMHMPGIFLSPTRNLTNTSRNQRHINPWDYPVKTHTYEEYEEEFRDSMKEVGLPIEKG
ncbi:MAG: sulfate reduction electron transfer complex DsrMKJOP subunit DsrM [Syntrophaceae bacterium]|nr:sulfate reduction electron transfer complex DsrMKJOP subunit DsrM [Syntrophaceae bacterium]